MTLVPLVLAALFALVQGSGPTTPTLWAGLTAGAWPVGYRHIDNVSTATDAWYPAATGGTTLSMRGYLGAGASEFAGFLTSAKVSETGVARYLDSPMAARRDAPAAAGAFPIIALAQGNAQVAADQAVLGEFLASQGFIVVTTASPMRLTPMKSEDEVGRFAETQANDLSRAIDAVSTWPSARSSVRFVVGHSFGARAALLLAMRDPKVRGVISLDGGIGTATGLDSYRRAPSFDANKASAPILHFYEALDEFMKPDFTLLKSLPARLTLRPLAGMHHSHFTSIGFGAAAMPELAALTKAGPEIRQSLRTMADEVLAFLQSASR